MQHQLAISKAAGITTVAVISSYLLAKKIQSHYKFLIQRGKQRRERLVVISGCDSGLGYSMAVWAATLGYKVLAGCLNENGEGPQKLVQEFPEQIITTRLNVTEKESLQGFQVLCGEILKTSEGKLELWAIIANAAVCTMGEFFWQTQRRQEYQMDVNFWGSVNLISEFRRLLLQAKARVIIISSDCSEYPLPFLSTYCASKAALNSWAQAFRFEMGKYGVHVVAYQPRDFSQRSGLFSDLELQYNQMAGEMEESDKKFYGDYFEKFMKRKQEVFATSRKKSIKVVSSSHHRNAFTHLLENDISRISVYRDFSGLEKLFHGLYSILPQSHLDKLVNSLLNPDGIQWKKPEITK